MELDRSAKTGLRAGSCGANSKEPKQIGSARVDDADEIADGAPETSGIPTDGTNCRGGIPAIPSAEGLGFWDSCMLALAIGKQERNKGDLPRFGTLDR